MVESSQHLTQRNGWEWCALAAVLFGAATPATKLVVDNIGAVTLAGLLYLGAAAAVAPFAMREQRPRATRRQRSRLLLAVGFGGGLAPVFLVVALDCTPAGIVSLFLNLELVATAVVARAFLQEHIGQRAGVGIVTSCSATNTSTSLTYTTAIHTEMVMGPRRTVCANSTEI
ncbi:MAG: DMT family transporter [Ilumatobacteraceae bacterium]